MFRGGSALIDGKKGHAPPVKPDLPGGDLRPISAGIERFRNCFYETGHKKNLRNKSGAAMVLILKMPDPAGEGHR